MKRLFAVIALLAVVAVPAAYVYAHCQVPCGIYDDDARFVEMHEHFDTISKADAEIAALADKTDALSKNQLVRWVTTKDDHATKVQRIIGDYFMAQRIKADDGQYVDKLTAAHKVMVAAMKCKQTVDEGVADELHSAIDAFQEAYTGAAAHGDH